MENSAVSQPRPAVAALLAEASAEPLPPADLTVPELRAFCDEGVLRRLHLVRRVPPLHAVRDLVSPGGVPVRLYVPTAASESGSLHIHLHGGGWWMGSIDTVDPMARELAAGLGIAVLSVDYRLAPEHPWPAAPDDVYDALVWMAEQFERISIGGESAGANLAAVVTLMARDLDGPRLVAQWLDVPAVDISLPDEESTRLYGTGFGLEISQLAMLVGWYGADVTHPYVSPVRADLQGLPPAIVTTAELDPLRDQGVAYAEALRAAGVPVELRQADGHLHGSSWLTGLDEWTGRWHDDIVGLLTQHHVLART
jgi:acetyl esterase